MRIGPLFIGWEDIAQCDCVALDLHPMYRWEGFYVEWGWQGIMLFARHKAVAK